MSKTIKINGTETEVPEGAVAWKYQDATEEEKWIFSTDEANEIAKEDPSLLEWVK